MSRTLVLGDVHGAARALEQVLERSGFGIDDELIFLGDVVDGWPETRECVDILLRLGSRLTAALVGNHDVWFRDWCAGTFDVWDRQLWLEQGGRATLMSYGVVFESPPEEVPEDHRAFFIDTMRSYYDDGQGRLFVHGGFVPGVPVAAQDESTLTWDRDLFKNAYRLQKRAELHDAEPGPWVEEYDEVYVGHTALKPNKPVRACNVWNVDTGAGWEGVLSIMDIDTKESWQSDPVYGLYPDAYGRRG